MDGGRSRPAAPTGSGKPRDPSLPPAAPRRRGHRAPVVARQALTTEHDFTSLQSQRTPQYLVIGHITADLQADGKVVLGGTALYSALTAARLGWRVGVLTRGAYGVTVGGLEIPSLEPYADEISIINQEADFPTVFVNEYNAGRRVQQIRHWAGPIDLRGLPPHWSNARVIHLGPIAQEIDQKQIGSLTPGFLGVTPQGFMREWPRETGGRVRLAHLRLHAELLSRIDGVVVSDEEIHLARDTVERVGAVRLGVVTKGELGAQVIFGGEKVDLPGYAVPTLDLTGAGDVFAAAFFIKATDRAASAETAGRFANAVAALSLRAVGADGIPGLREAEHFLNEIELRRKGR